MNTKILKAAGKVTVAALTGAAPWATAAAKLAAPTVPLVKSQPTELWHLKQRKAALEAERSLESDFKKLESILKDVAANGIGVRAEEMQLSGDLGSECKKMLRRIGETRTELNLEYFKDREDELQSEREGVEAAITKGNVGAGQAIVMVAGVAGAAFGALAVPEGGNAGGVGAGLKSAMGIFGSVLEIEPRVENATQMWQETKNNIDAATEPGSFARYALNLVGKMSTWFVVVSTAGRIPSQSYHSVDAYEMVPPEWNGEDDD